MAAPVLSTASWKMAAQDLKSDLDFTTGELMRMLELAVQLKRAPDRYTGALKGRYLSLLFEKPSLRTRMTFELAIRQLGGDSVFANGPIGDREPIRDVARNLDRWTSGIVARTYSQSTIEELARWASVPVINALSDLYHPCQALADVLTLNEKFGRLEGLKLAFIGDGNNVAHSLMLNASRMGMGFSLATPSGYEANADVVAQARDFAIHTGAEVRILRDPYEAVAGAHAVYTDVWASMGQEHEADGRKQVFSGYQVNRRLMAAARDEAVFMHCLPAKRGLEVTDEVMEMPRSVVFDQAENRLHVQKALLLMLLE